MYYDFGVMFGEVERKQKKTKWNLIELCYIPWKDLTRILQVTKSDLAYMPTKEYECPSHLIPMIEEHAVRRESQLFHYGHGDYNCPAGFMWKLNTVIRSCHAAERLDIEGRALGSKPLRTSALLELPRWLLHRESDIGIYAGFVFKGDHRWLEPKIASVVRYDDSRYGIGLVVHYAIPERVKWELRDRLVAMRIIQQARQKRNKGSADDMYGIVTSGELIQFHKLTINGEILSSPVFLLDIKGLPTIWNYLRCIIHAIQLKAPLPVDPKKCGIRETPLFRVAQMVLNHRWGLNSDGTPYEEPDDSPEVLKNTRLRRQYLERRIQDPGSVECDRTICNEPEFPEDDAGDERPCPSYPDLI